MHHDPVHKITIISRGMTGGYTRSLPTEDRYYMTRSHFIDMVSPPLWAATPPKHVVFGEISTGAENDIERATNIARKMVKEYGHERAARAGRRSAASKSWSSSAARLASRRTTRRRSAR